MDTILQPNLITAGNGNGAEAEERDNPRVAWIITWLLAIQFFYINLTFSTFTQNIVMLKDTVAPGLSMVILAVWICGELFTRGRFTLRRHPVNAPFLALMFLMIWHTAFGWFKFRYNVLQGWFGSPVPFSSVEEFGKFFTYFVQVWAMLRWVKTQKQFMFLVGVVVTTAVVVNFYGYFQHTAAWPLNNFDIYTWISQGLFGYPQNPQYANPNIMPFDPNSYNPADLSGWSDFKNYINFQFTPFRWGRNPLPFVSTHGNPNFFAGFMAATTPLILGLFVLRLLRLFRGATAYVEQTAQAIKYTDSTVEPGSWVPSGQTFFGVIGHLMREIVVFILLGILLAVAAVCTVWTTARGAYIGLGAAGGLFALLMILHLFSVGRSFFPETISRATRMFFLKIVATAAVLLILTVTIAGVFGAATDAHYYHSALETLETLSSQIKSLAPGGEFTNYVRIIMWQGAARMCAANPGTGMGFGAFNMMFSAARPVWYHRFGVSHNTRHAHNEWLEWLSETGIPGTVIYVWLIAVIMIAGLITLWSRRKGYYFPLYAGALCGVVAWIGQATFDVESRWTGNSVTNWFIVGLALCAMNLPNYLKDYRAYKADQQRPLPSPSDAQMAMGYMATFVCVVILVFYASTAWKLFRADHHQHHAMSYIDQAGPGSPNYLELMNEGIRRAEKCRELDPTTLSNYYKLAYAYMALGQYDLAMSRYQELQMLSPNYAQIHSNLGILHSQIRQATLPYLDLNRDGRIDTLEGKFEDGIRNFKIGWEWERAVAIEDNTNNHMRLANYYAENGRMEKSLQHYRSIFRIIKDNPEGTGTLFLYRQEEAHISLGDAYLTRGDAIHAEREYLAALALDPSYVDGYLRLVNLYFSQERRPEAQTLLDQAHETVGDDKRLLTVMGHFAFLNGNYSQALNRFEEALTGIPLPQSDQEAQANYQSIARYIIDDCVQIDNAGYANKPQILYVVGRAHAVVGQLPTAEEQLSLANRHGYAKALSALADVRARREIIERSNQAAQ